LIYDILGKIVKVQHLLHENRI